MTAAPAHNEPLTRLVEAARQGDVATLRALLDADAELANARTDQGETPVLVAAYHQQPEALALLAERARLDVFEAAVVGRADRVDELLSAEPALTRARAADGWTALHLAAFFGSASAAERLLAHGADVGAISENAQANTPLHAALAGRGDPLVVDLLLAAGADVKAVAAHGVTPLHLAASRGNLDLIRRLLDRGADPAAAMSDGTTPAAMAHARGHPEAAGLLGRA
jgi:ankyrin repeat protein